MFEGLHIALSGIRAAQLSMDTATNNIANATNPGYTRQRVDLATLTPWRVPQGEIGMGVDVTSISRLRETHLDARARSTGAAAAFANARSVLLGQSEEVLGEPDQGVTQALSTVYDAFDQVALDPHDPALRDGAMHALAELARTIRATAAGLDAQATQGQADAAAALDEANTLLARVDVLNREIASGGGGNAALDERDLLVDQLSKLVGATAETQVDGTVHISLDGETLVQTATPRVRELAWVGGEVQVGSPGTTVTAGGEVGGIHTYLTNDLTGLQDALDEFALDLRDAINGVNALGSVPPQDPGGASWTDGGPPLLAASRAGDLTLASGVSGADLATAELNARAVHDATNAGRFAALRGGAPPAGGAALDERLRTLVTTHASDTATAQARAATSLSLHTGAQAARQAGHGVNLDEEMVSIVQQQRALEAASRAMTAIDEALDTLFNRTGIVGR